MSNWIICPVRNNIALTKKAVASFRGQDVGDLAILVINNGSRDGTAQWLMTQPDIFRIHAKNPGLSVAASWNRGLRFVFERQHQDHALVVNNDVELRPDTYSWLLADGGGFVTAVGVDDAEKIKPPLKIPDSKSPHPDFSCFLIRREIYEKVGPFDENFKVAFAEDWDYHLRLHRAGITAWAINLPYLHYGSQTIRNADENEQERIGKQADANREYFFQKWGVRGGTEEYYKLFDTEHVENG